MTYITCPLCLSSDTEMLFAGSDRLFQTTDSIFQILRCLECGILFLYPMPSSQDICKYYPTGYWVGSTAAKSGLKEKLTECYRRVVLFDHVRFVRQIIRKQHQFGVPVKLLDVGCGDGSILEALGVSSCMGLDTSADALHATQSRGVSAVQGLLTETPFKENSFSIITMFHFLEHIPSPAFYLDAVKRLLIPDGDLVIQVPNADSYQARLFKKKWAGYDIPRHLIDYSAKTLCRTLSQNGFKVIRQTQFSLRDNSPMIAMSLFPGLYPPARAVCQPLQGGVRDWVADLAFLGITLMSLPFTLIESLLGEGATVMVHAKNSI